MRFRWALAPGRIIVVCLLLGSAVLLSRSDKPVFSRQDKAYYAEASVVNFVRPGLIVRIMGGSIASDGTVTAQLAATDPKGLPLDVAGVTTPGSIGLNFVVSDIPKGQRDYTAITTQSVTSSTTGATAVQPAFDTGRNLQQTADGQYTYTFSTRAGAGFDRSSTVSIGVWAARDLSDFDLGVYKSDDVFTFVPDSSAPPRVHDEIRGATCNKCHESLDAHGGTVPDVRYCVLCHTEDFIDPNTGNNLRLRVVIHKLHMGENLPSVQAGKPYQIISPDGEVNDFSDIVFPADVRNCTFCHENGIAPPPASGQPGQGGSGAPPIGLTTSETLGPVSTGTQQASAPADANYWLMHPGRQACGSCHDNVDFATGENHVNLPQLNDSACANCHIVQGELPFDASILGAHTIPQFAPGLPGVVFKLIRVDNGQAGKAPVVTFNLTDKSGNPIQPSRMDFLSVVMAGPTGDYASVISEDARTGATGQNGTYTYTFQHTIPKEATGTYSIGIEGYRNITLLPGTVRSQTVRDVGFNDVINFSVDGSNLAPHPIEVTQAQCNSCHFALSVHGTIRQNVQYCLLCHNPAATDAALRPASENPPQAIDFPVMIHRIHTGEGAGSDESNEGDLQLTPYIIWGFGNRPNDFSGVRYPGDRRSCDKCHTNDSQQAPVPETRIAVTNPRAFINPTPPTTAACTACHVEKAASAHAALATDPKLGESCGVCHSPGAEFSVDKVHAHSL